MSSNCASVGPGWTKSQTPGYSPTSLFEIRRFWSAAPSSGKVPSKIGPWVVLKNRERSRVQVHNFLKFVPHVERVVKKAFSMLAFFAQIIDYRNCEVMVRLHRTLVRPLLEYRVQFWLPWYREDIIKLERVQKRFTRMLPGME
eukprot:g28706.t1